MNMPITMQDTKPIGLCIATQELFDTKRFLHSYCDGLILRGDDAKLRNKLTAIKRELNAFRTQRKFLDGYKAIITSNTDKILGLVTARYAKSSPREVEQVVKGGKDMIEKVLKIESFPDVFSLEGEFKSRITIPTYRLFIGDLKRSKIRII